MFRSVLRLRPRPGGDRDLLDYFERQGILARALCEGGCASAELSVRIPGRDEVVVSALWNSEADYDAWQRTSQRGVEILELERLVDPASLPIGTGEIHEVLVAVPGELA